MFKCQITGRLSKPGEKLVRLVVKTRPATYTEWRVNEELRKREYVQVGSGVETVKELLVSQEGKEQWATMTEEHRARFMD